MLARIAAMIALTALFAGCASYDNGYRDGAYYHPSRGHEGDYYYGRPPVNRGYYSPYYGPYGAPFYYSPYPYYRPYRYRPYYGPFRSSYYRSGFGAAYAYGGFSGYRDFGHSHLALGLVYSDHDRHARDEHRRSDRDRHDRRDERADRFDAGPIIERGARRDASLNRPGFADDPRAFERRRAQPVPRLREAPEPTTVRLQPEAGRLVQMRRIDNEQGKNKKRFAPQPTPQPARAAPVNMPATSVPGYRGAQVERRPPARERNNAIPPPARALPQARSPQQRLNEPAQDGGKKPRNASQLEDRIDTVDE